LDQQHRPQTGPAAFDPLSGIEDQVAAETDVIGP
jgi:hypothetical protein